ncbi:MAG: adenylosuccinate synthase, partial [Nitrospirae bacterium]|nr:adenylosuccinate synthase [Nitrospirota bacterium]
NILEKCEPIYEEVSGWKENTGGAKSFEKLPSAAQAYIKEIERMLNVKVRIISSGQKRDELIMRGEIF